MKISKKLLCGFASIICFVVIVGIIGITGMNKLREASLLTYEQQVLALGYTGMANATFKEMRIYCRQIVINGIYDDSKGAADAKEKFETLSKEFTYWLEESSKIATSDELLKFYQRIDEIFNGTYLPMAEVLINESINDIPDHANNLYINVYLVSLTNAGEQIEALILGSMDLNTALANQTNNNNDEFTQTYIQIQAFLIVAAVIAALIVALYITKSISVPISESAEVLGKIAKGAFEERVRGNYKGELALIKNAVNESAEQLSIYLKEKLQEDKIKELAAIVAIADAGIIVKNKDGVVRSWNIGAENILGYKSDEIVGKTTKSYAPEESHSRIDDIERCLQNGEHIVHEDVVRKHKEGRLIDCSASYTPIFDDHGIFTGSVAIFHDVTDKKWTERALQDAVKAAEEASQAKSLFLANMSHEIRTPMNGIIGFSELAMDDGDVPAKTKDYFYRIKTSAEGLLGIINDILDISKIEAGKMILERIPFDLCDVLKDCETICNPKAIEKGLFLDIYSEPVITKRLLGDPTKLRQILLNLLSNAIKFTDAGVVKLMVAVREAAGDNIALYFEVQDNGIGMTAEQIQEIFEPFVQADSGTTRKYGGTGIGLSITKNMVELMGGELTVESTLGLGSKFGFCIKFKTASDIVDVSENDGMQMSKLLKPIFQGDVLVCEDNETNQWVIQEHLARIGLNAIIAENGEQGVNIVNSRLAEGKAFDIIFMDIYMPVMDGLEASEKLIEIGNKAPVIALTANIMQDNIEAYRKSGMVDCLGKPFKGRELWDCLLRYLIPVDLIPITNLVHPAPIAYSGGDLSVGDTLINRVIGLEQTDGDEKLYQRLLKNFANDNKTTLSDFQDAINAGDDKLAHRIVHTLKSVAGLIGATELQKVAYAVEEALSCGSTALPNRLVDSFKATLDAVLRELTPLLKSHETEEQPIGNLDRDRALELINKLESLLESGSSKSLHLLEGIADILSPIGEQSHILASQIENYEFESALETLKDIGQKIS